MRLAIIFFIFSVTTFGQSFGDDVIWEGKIDGNGSPTEAVKLILDEKYQIKATGTVKLGKWKKAGKPLIEDAAYEFNEESAPEPLITLRNSQNISISDGKYHADHVYKSEPFVAKENRIHFWIFDNDYDNNSGNLNVEIIKVK